MLEHSSESSEPVPRRHLRFSLLSLFVVVSALCALLTWWVQPRKYVVETMFHVSATQPVLLERASEKFDQREYDLLRKTHSQLIQSDMVIMSALRDPQIAALQILQSPTDPVEWVRKRLEVRASGGSELLVIRMRCGEAATSDCQLLLDAISDAYVNNVIFNDEQRRLVVRDWIVHEISELQDRLAQKMSKLESDSKLSAAEKTVAQIEIDALSKLLQDLIRQQGIMNLGNGLPGRVRRVQKATVRPDSR